MSFITKRERVFNEYDLFDLPARNEGKLKAYASCTDARAWSHFCSDKSEHLVEIIKRNNETCRPKYVPTEAIVNTLLANKHAEIARLKRKIEEFEQMLAAYGDLDLTCEQKCEIAKAHAAIKEANKDLNELCFDLDLSGFTGIDSEDFETGKSRGDEPSKYKEENEETPRSKGDEWYFEKEAPSKETKSNQAGGMNCYCHSSTSAVDPRIEEMHELLICKDAKLNAMKNSMAVMENDVCEPYCIYAHIYTALEKIFGILCQNDKYKLYLDYMTSGKNTRCLDIKGKILFKLKVLEKFNVALIAPCSQDFVSQNEHNSHGSEQECPCYRAEMGSRVEATYALTSAESQDTCVENKRAQFIADIMENEEMKDILNKKNYTLTTHVDLDDDIILEAYDINQENLKRIKNLQENYDSLMTCYETLKVEKDDLLAKCRKYDDLQKEFEGLQTQLREYNALWNEKEHYRKRSLDLDTLNNQYLVLYDEATNLETELKAKSEINDVKTRTIEDLRSENIALEKRLTDASIAFEKEKNYARCKLNESECTIMCQGQQIKSLSLQIDKLLEQDPDGVQPKQQETSIIFINEINALKESLKKLQDALFVSEEEKQHLEEEYKTKLNFINDLKLEIADLQIEYKQTLQHKDYLENYADSLKSELNTLKDKNKRDVEEKSKAIDNLMNVIHNKSQEISKLIEEVEYKNKENHNLFDEIHRLHDAYKDNISALDSEKLQATESLHLARHESRELLERVKEYDEIIQKKDSLSQEYKEQNEKYKALLTRTQEENKILRVDLASHVNKNSILMQEIQILKNVNNDTEKTISSLQDKTKEYNLSLELTRKESKVLEDKLQAYEDLSHEIQQIKNDKNRLAHELANQTLELNTATLTIQLTKKENKEMQEKLRDSENKAQRILDSLNNLKALNDNLSQRDEALSKDLISLKKMYDLLLSEKEDLQNDFDVKTEENFNLHNNLESKIEENRTLVQQIELLENNHKTVQHSINTLQKEHFYTKNTLNSVKKESDELINRLKYYEKLELDFDRLKKEHDQMKEDKYKLTGELKKVEEENLALSSESQNMFSHNEELEKALINARTQLIVGTSNAENPLMEITKEIEVLKREKISKHNEIRNLLDKLDESENIISNLSEDIQARDDKIAILENHINELQDEVKRLHSSLAEIIDTGEQIKENSYQRIRNSLDTMEAHHSKATHNMKMELAKLQSDNIALEDRLSIDNMKNEVSAQDKHKYISQLAHLQNEREIIVTDIKQLELNSVGDSALSPENCNVEEILRSLDRIRRYLDARSSKSTALEHTLLKVQNSYQVVQKKADEAKKIVEKEKQKILNEKEEAIRDRHTMEKQLTDLKEQLEKQVLDDKNVIRDLEAEISNHKLIIDKLNQSTQRYILKLKEEIQSLQELYSKSLENIQELEKKLNLTSEETKTHLNIIEEVNIALQEKSMEVNKLKKYIDDLQNTTKHSQGTQALLSSKIDKETQTHEDIPYKDFDEYFKSVNTENIEDTSIKKPTVYEYNVPLKETTKHGTEVQVLTALTEPGFDYIKKYYLTYKLKRLSLGPLEHGSYVGRRENDVELDAILNIKEDNINHISNGSSDNNNFIDINNMQNIYKKRLNSSNSNKNRDIKTPDKTSTVTDLDLTINSFNTLSSPYKDSNLFRSVSGKSTDIDLFIIYKDSETNQANYSNINKSLPTSDHSNEIVEGATFRRGNDSKQSKRDNFTKNQRTFESDLYMYSEDEELKDDSIKNQIKIKLPRVRTDTSTADKISEEDKKSIDSYTINIYPASKSTYSSENKMENNSKTKSWKDHSNHLESNDSQYLGSQVFDKYDNNNKIYTSNVTYDKNLSHPSDSTHLTKLLNENNIPSSNFDQTRLDNQSQHMLSRIDKDIHLIKTEGVTSTTAPIVNGNKIVNDKNNNYGLNYILATTQMNPDHIKIYSAARSSLRKSRSDELYNSAKTQEKSDTSPSNNQSSLSMQKKTYTEKGVNTTFKLETIEDYEMKLNYLTENIRNHYEKKIEAVKMQYDSNIKNILNDHNEGVKSIQGLHEETLQDIIKHHENEVENLRSMSIEAMRKTDKLEKECRCLKYKLQVCGSLGVDEEPVKIDTSKLKRQRKYRLDSKTLTKTKIEAFNVKPKSQTSGPCTCSLDINISDTIRNIFEHVDIEQRKKAEHTYLKYIANKMLHDTVETLDCHELSFLHLKVCRIWKNKLTKEETLQKRIDSLEAELMTKQWDARNNMVELDREVAEQRRRLQEKREAVCRQAPTASRFDNSEAKPNYVTSVSPTADKNIFCSCNNLSYDLNVDERQSGGDLVPAANSSLRPKLTRPETNRVLAKIEAEDRRERRKKEEDKKLYTDELPTRLRRPLIRPSRK